MAEGALSDLRVIELAEGIAGPYCAKLFADLGAEVIKVEPPEGDRSRRLGPYPNDTLDPEQSGLFLHLNTGKKSVTLDAAVTSGQVIVKKLLEQADVLIAGEAPSRLAEWGLSHDDLKNSLPKLIHVSITPFGATGPYRDYQGNSLTAMAMSTIMYNTGDPDRAPLTTGGTPAEYIAGIHAWIGALAAIAYRSVEGRGQQVDVSLAEAAACADEYNAAMYAFQGAIRRRFYSRHIFGYPMDIMPCKDGHIVLIPGAGGFPQRGLTEEGAVSPMSLLLGNPELDQDPLFTSGQERMVRWQEIDELLMPWLAEHTANEIIETAQALRMPFAPVPTVKELLEDEHLGARAFFQPIEHPVAGELRYAGAPFRMSETPPSIGPAPRLGEHNEATLSGLGYSPDDLAILRERNVT
ncbi:MAG: CoA transferase [Chloroflexi bacterium]|nr:CoA transferase [Chloroflexota bacterium]